jgi:hypothetical protein
MSTHSLGSKKLKPDPDLFSTNSESGSQFESGSPNAALFLLSHFFERGLCLFVFKASPATVDFCVSLDRDFNKIVVNSLGQMSRKALLEQQDPASLPETHRKNIQKEILSVVFGKLRRIINVVFGRLKEAPEWRLW